MLTISRGSYDALAAAGTTDFIRRLRGALQDRFPERSASFDGDRLDGLVAIAIAHGQQYRIASEWNVSHYVMAMLLLGNDFDTDPALPWATRMLTDDSRPLGERTAALVEAASAHAKNLGSGGGQGRAP